MKVNAAMAEHKDSSNYYFRSAARGNVVTDRTAQRGRAAILGAGALASAAAALGGAQLVAGPEEKERPLLEKICLSSDVPLVEGLSEGCYDRDVFLAFRERPVLRGEGSPITVTLADPKDDLAPLPLSKHALATTKRSKKAGSPCQIEKCVGRRILSGRAAYSTVFSRPLNQR